jgi:transcriptional regulator with XRE-family HTH domain
MTDAITQRARELRSQGHSFREIAEMIGLSKSATAARLKGEAPTVVMRSRAGLTPDDVRIIRALKGQFAQAKIASRFGVSVGTVQNIQSGRAWRRV